MTRNLRYSIRLCSVRHRWTAAAFLLPIVLSFRPSRSTAQDFVHSELADAGIVVSESAAASRIGRDVMAAGGNAVDAAVATAFALAVTWPEAGNLGGGGFMMIRPANGVSPVCIDYRETAPLAATVDMFSLSESRYTHKMVGVPGTVRGLAVAHEKYGRLSWKRVVSPAARLAEQGFGVDSFLADSTNRVLDASRGNKLFAELHRVYSREDGSPWQHGHVMRLPELAATLRTIAERGPTAFYHGSIADLLLAEMKTGGGLIRAEDLQAYEANIRQPIVATFNGYQILGAPPPSSGGTAVAQTLNMVEAISLPRTGRFEPQTIHLLAEISRRVFLDRARYLGDADFVEIPDKLIRKEYARELVADIRRDQATDSVKLAPEIKLADESESTTHFSVVDADGMAVSNTYTLEASWGSRIVVPGAGFVLNNEMGDFNWKKGHTDHRGRIGTDANLIAPGKRMLSSQCPVIVTKDDQVVLVTGSPGGRTIINTVLNVVLNVTHFDMSVAAAVQAPRLHHQWMPDVLSLEDADTSPHKDATSTLESYGHRIVSRESQGSAHSIGIDPLTDRMVGVADYRRGGRPAGIHSKRIARWDFGERAGTELHNAVATGLTQLKWEGSIAGSTTDGRDHLEIRRDAPDQPSTSYVPLTNHHGQLAATVEFDGIAFAGTSRNEKVQLAFTQTRGNKPVICASVTVARNSANQIVIFGEALGDGGTSVEPVVLSREPRWREPLAVRLTADMRKQRFQILLRRGSASRFTEIGRGQTATGRSIKFGRLRALNDFNARGEYVNIDAVEFTAEQTDARTHP